MELGKSEMGPFFISAKNPFYGAGNWPNSTSLIFTLVVGSRNWSCLKQERFKQRPKRGYIKDDTGSIESGQEGAAAGSTCC